MTEETRQNGGAVAWTVIAAVFWAIVIAGCTYTRNGPLIESHITANGNTVPVSARP